jgi:hypothetical protein
MDLCNQDRPRFTPLGAHPNRDIAERVAAPSPVRR